MIKHDALMLMLNAYDDSKAAGTAGDGGIVKMMTINMLNNDEHACAYEKHKHCDK